MPRGRLRQAIWIGGQFSSLNTLFVTPRSFRKAEPACCFKLGWLAFQPKRPTAREPCCVSDMIQSAVKAKLLLPARDVEQHVLRYSVEQACAENRRRDAHRCHDVRA